MKLRLPTRLLAFVFLCSAGCGMATAQTYEQYVERALSAAAHDSLPEAEALFRQALKASPDDYRNALVFNNLGKIQERIYWEDTSNKAKVNEALESYTSALQLMPESVPLLTSRAYLYMRLELWEKAIADMTTILDFAPTDSEVRNYRAFCYMEKQLYTEARTDYIRILEREPNNRLALLGMVMIEYTTDHLSEALRRITLLIDAVPDEANYYYLRSRMYTENQQPELAIMDLDRAILLDPQNTDYLLARARLHKQQGNRRLALADFEQAISLGVPRASLRQELKECR